MNVAAEHVERGYLRLPAEPADRWLAVVRIDEMARPTGGGGIEDALDADSGHRERHDRCIVITPIGDRDRSVATLVVHLSVAESLLSWRGAF